MLKLQIYKNLDCNHPRNLDILLKTEISPTLVQDGIMLIAVSFYANEITAVY